MVFVLLIQPFDALLTVQLISLGSIKAAIIPQLLTGS
jgi:hypothetical protein